MDRIKVQLNEKEILKDIIDLRRKFHKNPELGWLEFETANEISEKLFQYGFNVSVGNEVITANKKVWASK
jgi:aminobenzoyl-glutamate utilization protein A